MQISQTTATKRVRKNKKFLRNLLLLSLLLSTLSLLFIFKDTFFNKTFYRDREYRITYLKGVVQEKKLNHIAMIIDGCRRWARKNGMKPSEGHQFAFLKKAPEILKDCLDCNIHTITFWCYSCGNFEKRDNQEVKLFINYCTKMIDLILPLAHKYQIKITQIGRKDRLPNNLKKQVLMAEQTTRNYNKHSLNLAMDYDGRSEILRGFKKLSKSNRNINNLSEEDFCRFIDTHDQKYPSPDIIVRSSGDTRLSGFMAWQSKYSELYFVSKSFPEFDLTIIENSIIEFSKRRRQFSR